LHLFTVETIWLKTLHVLLFLQLSTKRVAAARVTAHPGSVPDPGAEGERLRRALGPDRAAAWRWPFPRRGSGSHRRSTLERSVVAVCSAA
jgi:hypothetical protein